MNLNLSEKLKTGLTPQEKIDCYERALSEVRRWDVGICYELSLVLSWFIPHKHTKIIFPELYKFKPKRKTYNHYWFNSTEERITVLNKLIEEQKKLL